MRFARLAAHANGVRHHSIRPFEEQALKLLVRLHV